MVDMENAINSLLGGGGGRVSGAGNGQSDEVPAVIDGNEPASLSAGEYVIPADVVSMLGNGDTEAGVKILEEMITRVRTLKQGNPDQAEELPVG